MKKTSFVLGAYLLLGASAWGGKPNNSCHISLLREGTLKKFSSIRPQNIALVWEDDMSFPVAPNVTEPVAPDVTEAGSGSSDEELTGIYADMPPLIDDHDAEPNNTEESAASKSKKALKKQRYRQNQKLKKAAEKQQMSEAASSAASSATQEDLSKAQKTPPPLECKCEKKPDPIFTEARINDLIKRAAGRIRQREKRQLIQEGLSDFKPKTKLGSSKGTLLSLANYGAQCFIMSDGNPAQYKLFSLWPSELFQKNEELLAYYKDVSLAEHMGDIEKHYGVNIAKKGLFLENIRERLPLYDMDFTLLTFWEGHEHSQRGVNPYNLEGFEPCHVKTDASQFVGNLHEIWKEVLEGSSKEDIKQLIGPFKEIICYHSVTQSRSVTEEDVNFVKFSVQWFRLKNEEPFLDVPGIYIMTQEEGDKKFFERCKKQAFFTNFLRIKVFNLLQKTLHIECLNKLRTEATAQISGGRPSEPFIEILAELPKEFHQEAIKHGKEKGLLMKNAS